MNAGRALHAHLRSIPTRRGHTPHTAHFWSTVGGLLRVAPAALNALRLSPRDPFNAAAFAIIFLSYYFEHDYPQALEAARQAISRYPNLPIGHRYLAASLGQLGRIDEAQEALKRAIALSSEVIALNVRSRPPPWMLPDDHQNFMEGLRKAGWQG